MLAIAYAAIATVNTLAGLVLARRREFGLPLQDFTETRFGLADGGLITVPVWASPDPLQEECQQLVGVLPAVAIADTVHRAKVVRAADSERDKRLPTARTEGSFADYPGPLSRAQPRPGNEAGGPDREPGSENHGAPLVE